MPSHDVDRISRVKKCNTTCCAPFIRARDADCRGQIRLPFHLLTGRPLCPTRAYVARERSYDTFKKKSGLAGVDREERGEEGRKEGSKSWARSVSDFLHSVSNQTFPQYHTLQQQGQTITRQPGIGGVKTNVDNKSRLCDFVFVQLKESPNHPVSQMHYGELPSPHVWVKMHPTLPQAP